MANWGKEFWKATAERVIATAAVSAGAVLSAEIITDVDWANIGSVTLIASTLTLLKCIAVNAGTSNGPGIGTAETLSLPATTEGETK
jgi:DNA-binding transcriptional regulator YdaS (Cro superfamily)